MNKAWALMTGQLEDTAAKPRYWHQAAPKATHTPCGIDVRGGVPSGPPPFGTPMCPICAHG
jgi:hypothetical protein